MLKGHLVDGWPVIGLRSDKKLFWNPSLLIMTRDALSTSAATMLTVILEPESGAVSTLFNHEYIYICSWLGDNRLKMTLGWNKFQRTQQISREHCRRRHKSCSWSCWYGWWYWGRMSTGSLVSMGLLIWSRRTIGKLQPTWYSSQCFSPGLLHVA